MTGDKLHPVRQINRERHGRGRCWPTVGRVNRVIEILGDVCWVGICNQPHFQVSAGKACGVQQNADAVRPAVGHYNVRIFVAVDFPHRHRIGICFKKILLPDIECSTSFARVHKQARNINRVLRLGLGNRGHVQGTVLVEVPNGYPVHRLGVNSRGRLESAIAVAQQQVPAGSRERDDKIKLAVSIEVSGSDRDAGGAAEADADCGLECPVALSKKDLRRSRRPQPSRVSCHH